MIRKSSLSTSILSAGVLLLVSFKSAAAPMDPNTLCRLAPPPSAGSEEFRRDAEVLLQYQAKRTAEQCEVARHERAVSLRAWFGPKTGVLTESELRRAMPASIRIFATVGSWAAVCKQHFRRLRPYIEIPNLKPCIQRPKHHDLSYPSGHAAVSSALAMVLARMFPAKAEKILKQGFRVGENRILSGVHYPSDVRAGRSVAKDWVKQLDLR